MVGKTLAAIGVEGAIARHEMCLSMNRRGSTREESADPWVSGLIRNFLSGSNSLARNAFGLRHVPRGRSPIRSRWSCKAIPKLLGHDSRILATDLDSDVLAHAKRDLYTDESLAAIHPDRLRTFSKGTEVSAMVRIEFRANFGNPSCFCIST